MADKDFTDSLIWAESIIKAKQDSVKNRADTASKLKIALYIFGAVVVVIALIYIVYRAYKIPDPLNILDEIKDLTNQVNASGIDDFESE